jgi:hypothetical protein
MNKMTKIHRYAIYWLNSQNRSSIEIANEIKLSEKQVIAVLETHTPTKDTQFAHEPTEMVENKISSKDLMISRTSAKGTKSVSIMTKEASELNDAMKKKAVTDTQKSDAQRGIFRPNK